VVGHEIGHIVHWDMLVMTAAALVPVFLYAVYRICIRARGNSSGKGNPLPLIALVALILYYVTEYVVLFLSRTRELYADRFSAEVTRKPNALASALVKIAYGLAGHREEPDEGSSGGTVAETSRSLGIFDPVGARALVASSLTAEGKPSKENVLAAMQWDLWNPWATYYELGSTHPLPARRLQYLGRQAASYGQEPYVDFNLKQPESYWDEFFVDLLALWAPYIGAGLMLAATWAGGHAGPNAAAHAVVGWAFGNLLRLWFSYDNDFSNEMTVAALLKKVKVSQVRAVPCTLKGKVIGRGVPGYSISEDIVVQDATGFLFVDYKQPMAIFQWIFALSRVPQLIGRDVTLKGWYRRAPVPYLELREIDDGTGPSRCYSLDAQYAFTILALLGAGAKGLGLW
jgi:hypothetical protein